MGDESPLMLGLCPLECVNAACSEPDFIEKHGTWLLTVVGVATTFVGGMFAYLLKSRCKKIDCCCVKCDREVADLEAVDVNSDLSVEKPKCATLSQLTSASKT